MHRFSVFYYLGGMTLFFFLVQIVTGVMLMLYYRPGAEEAFESVELIITTVPFGWLIRSLHSWSANLMVFFAVMHLLSVFFLKAYRAPREITWITGVLLLFLILGFGFSGYLLPWNQLAYFATKVGTDVGGAIPFVGEWTVRFLRGGDRVTGATLSRFYGWHIALLPAITIAVLAFHLVLVQTKGMSVPKACEDEARRRTPMKFFPHFALRDLSGWLFALGVLAALAALLPWELGEKADLFAPAYEDIRPEWYFVFMFQTLKVTPGGEILGVETEAIPLLLFGIGGALLMLVPFLDRRSSRTWTVAGIGAAIFVVAMTCWGYGSLLPLLVVAVSALLLGLFAFITRGPRALMIALLFLAATARLDAATSCTSCHKDVKLTGDVHAEVGLSCHDCHGGNPDPALAADIAAMDPSTGFRATRTTASCAPRWPCSASCRTRPARSATKASGRSRAASPSRRRNSRTTRPCARHCSPRLKRRDSKATSASTGSSTVRSNCRRTSTGASCAPSSRGSSRSSASARPTTPIATPPRDGRSWPPYAAATTATPTPPRPTSTPPAASPA